MEKSIETKLKKQVFFWKPYFSSHKFSGFSCDFFDSSRISKNPAKFDFAKGEFLKQNFREKKIKSLAPANACTTEFSGRYASRKLPYISKQFWTKIEKNIKINVLALEGRSSRRFFKIRKVAKSLAQPYHWRLGLARPSPKKTKIEKTCF